MHGVVGERKYFPSFHRTSVCAVSIISACMHASLPLSILLYLFLSVFLSLSLCLCLCICICLSPPFPFSLSIYVSRCLCFPLPLSLSLSLTVSLFCLLSVFLCLSVPVSLSLSLYVCQLWNLVSGNPIDIQMHWQSDAMFYLYFVTLHVIYLVDWFSVSFIHTRRWMPIFSRELA